MKEYTFFMIGMPSSGKTTYLVSLYNLLTLGEKNTLLSLKSSDQIEGMETIKLAIENFNKFLPVGRTLRAEKVWAKMPLVDEKEHKVSLHIPDLSGEIFYDLVYDRKLKKDIVDFLQSADVLLFFLNLDTIIVDQRIPLEEESAIARIEKDYKESVIEEGKKRCIEASGEQKKPVTQIDLVELLQCILYLTKKRIKVKFIISAWDSVEKRPERYDQVPNKCMEKSLPLLFQFLCSNPDQIDNEIWGVSAQGFDFTDQAELEKRKMDDIGEHIRLITPQGEATHDLTQLLFLN